TFPRRPTPAPAWSPSPRPRHFRPPRNQSSQNREPPHPGPPLAILFLSRPASLAQKPRHRRRPGRTAPLRRRSSPPRLLPRPRNFLKVQLTPIPPLREHLPVRISFHAKCSPIVIGWSYGTLWPWSSREPT